MHTTIDAQQEILEFRDRHYPGATRIVADDFSSVVYRYRKNEWYCAAGYKGLSKKTFYAYKFPTEQARMDHVLQWQGRVGGPGPSKQPGGATL